MSGPNVRLAEPLKSQAATLARSRGQSLNAFVAEAVRAYLAGSSAQDPVAAPDGPSVAGGRSASPKPEGSSQKQISEGNRRMRLQDPCSDIRFFTCSTRFRPCGILGADFVEEFDRSRFVSTAEEYRKDPTYQKKLNQLMRGIL